MIEINNVDEEDMQSFADVFGIVVESEADGDHIQSLIHTYGDVMKWYGDVLWPSKGASEIEPEEVETALQIAKEHIGNTTQTSFSIHVGKELPEIENEELLRY